MNEDEKYLEEFYRRTEIGEQNMMRIGYILNERLRKNPFYNACDISLPKDTTMIDRHVNDLLKPGQFYLVARYALNIMMQLSRKYPSSTKYARNACIDSLVVFGTLNLKIPYKIVKAEIIRADTKNYREINRQAEYIERVMNVIINTRKARIN